MKKDLEALAEAWSVEGRLREYERLAQELAGGLRRKDKERRARLEDVQFRAQMARQCLTEGRAEDAVLNAILMTEAGARADARFTQIGVRESTRQKENRGERQTYGGISLEEIRARNEQIRKAFAATKLRPRQWGKFHAQEYGLSVRQIRRILSGPPTR
jgi:hypothetical protein